MKMKSVIIDDEPMARFLLRSLLEECCPEVCVAGEADCIEDALPLIEKERPHILFLDISMPSGNGFELLEKVYDPARFYTVFVTAYKDHALRALKKGATDFILKPLDPEEVRKGVRKIYNAYSGTLSRMQTFFPMDLDKQITISNNKGFRILKLREIVRIEASDNYTNVFLSDGSRLLTTKTLKDMEGRLNYSWFLRTHKSHLINLFHLVAYLTEDGGTALMSDRSKLPVTRFKMNEIVAYINRFSNEL